MSVQGNAGGKDQSFASLKSTVPPENSALLKSAAPPENPAPPKPTVARRAAEGKTKTEIMRRLKRYIAREAFPHLIAGTPAW